MVKIELERWEVCKLIALLNDDIRVCENLLKDGYSTCFDDMLKGTVTDDQNIVNRLGKFMEV